MFHRELETEIERERARESTREIQRERATESQREPQRFSFALSDWESARESQKDSLWLSLAISLSRFAYKALAWPTGPSLSSDRRSGAPALQRFNKLCNKMSRIKRRFVKMLFSVGISKFFFQWTAPRYLSYRIRIFQGGQTTHTHVYVNKKKLYHSSLCYIENIYILSWEDIHTILISASSFQTMLTNLIWRKINNVLHFFEIQENL